MAYEISEQNEIGDVVTSYIASTSADGTERVEVVVSARKKLGPVM